MPQYQPLYLGFSSMCRIVSTLKAFPSKAKVIFNVNMTQIDSIKPGDFSIGIMYGDIYGNTSDKVKLTLLKHPEGVRNIRIIPNEVEYLIEHQ